MVVCFFGAVFFASWHSRFGGFFQGAQKEHLLAILGGSTFQRHHPNMLNSPKDPEKLVKLKGEKVDSSEYGVYCWTTSDCNSFVHEH